MQWPVGMPVTTALLGGERSHRKEGQHLGGFAGKRELIGGAEDPVAKVCKERNMGAEVFAQAWGQVCQPGIPRASPAVRRPPCDWHPCLVLESVTWSPPLWERESSFSPTCHSQPSIRPR